MEKAAPLLSEETLPTVEGDQEAQGIHETAPLPSSTESTVATPAEEDQEHRKEKTSKESSPGTPSDGLTTKTEMGGQTQDTQQGDTAPAMNPAAFQGWMQAPYPVLGMPFFANFTTQPWLIGDPILGIPAKGSGEQPTPLVLGESQLGLVAGGSYEQSKPPALDMLPKKNTPPRKKKAAKKRKDDDEDYDPMEDRPVRKRKKKSAAKQKPPACADVKPNKGGKPLQEDKFDTMCEQFKAYKAEHGHCRVPLRPRTKLGNWIEAIRHQYRYLKRGEKSTITVERLVKLTEIGFVFNARPESFISWEKRIEMCKAFIAKHGHLRIPRRHPELGSWASHMRRSYKRRLEGGKHPLSDERYKLLEELGFVWLVGQRMPAGSFDNRKSWEERFEEFKEYKQIHGHPFVPQHLEGGLGRWVSSQRVQYKLKQKGEKSLMTTDKLLLLVNAGFAFDASTIRRTPKSALEEEEEEDGGDISDDCWHRQWL